jgi:hypothetical protein
MNRNRKLRVRVIRSQANRRGSTPIIPSEASGKGENHPPPLAISLALEGQADLSASLANQIPHLQRRHRQILTKHRDRCGWSADAVWTMLNRKAANFQQPEDVCLNL